MSNTELDVEKALATVSCSTYDMEGPLPPEAVLANEVVRLQVEVDRCREIADRDGRDYSKLKKQCDDYKAIVDKLPELEQVLNAAINSINQYRTTPAHDKGIISVLCTISPHAAIQLEEAVEDLRLIREAAIEGNKT